MKPSSEKEVLYVGGNGCVYAIRASNCQILWELELRSGWFISGTPFVSLRETPLNLFAFAYGRMFKIEKRTGNLIAESEQIKNLKHRAGVFASSVETVSSDLDDAVLAGDSSDGGGDAGGSDGGGDGGGD